MKGLSGLFYPFYAGAGQNWVSFALGKSHPGCDRHSSDEEEVVLCG